MSINNTYIGPKSMNMTYIGLFEALGRAGRSVRQNHDYTLEGPPPPCNSGIIGISEAPNIIPIIPYNHYYWVGGPPKLYLLFPAADPLHPGDMPSAKNEAQSPQKVLGRPALLAYALKS